MFTHKRKSITVAPEPTPYALLIEQYKDIGIEKFLDKLKVGEDNQTLFDQGIGISEFLNKLRAVENSQTLLDQMNVHDQIEFYGNLRTKIIPELTSVRSDCTRLINADFKSDRTSKKEFAKLKNDEAIKFINADEYHLFQKVQKEFAKLSKEEASKFKDENEYKQFQALYSQTLDAIAAFKVTIEAIFDSLPGRQEKEDEQAKIDAAKPKDFAARATWLTDELALYAANQFNAIRGPTFSCSDDNEKRLYLILTSKEAIVAKRAAVGTYFTLFRGEEDLFYDILATIQNVAQIDHTHHWLVDTNMMKSIKTEFHARSCASLLNAGTPKSVSLTLDYLASTPTDEIGLSNRRVVADYYLESRKNQKPDRLSMILEKTKKNAPAQSSMLKPPGQH